MRTRRRAPSVLAIFVGLLPPTFFLLGKVMLDLEATPEEQAGCAKMQVAA
jgi:hypothetical protein